jgi:uncharacterized protein (TIGR03435 family)
MTAVRSGILLALLAVPVLAQPASESPAFEVASIKLSGPQNVRGASGGPGRQDPTRYSFNSATLLDLIAIAYHVDYFQVASKIPLEQNRFDFAARVPAGATREQFRVMMQGFLTERFHLRQHIESRAFPGFELTVAKSGAKLKESTATRASMAAHHSASGGYLLTRVEAQQQTTQTLAEFLPSPDAGPIVDRTGLAGKYDFTLEFTRDRPGAAPESHNEPPAAPDLFTSLLYSSNSGGSLCARRSRSMWWW